METGKKYKLADKCITPGGRNMTRDEDVIIEAKKYYRNDIKCYDAFLHGVEWAEEQIANVWHDASEEPKKGEDIIALDIDGISVSGIYKDYNGNGIYRYHCFLCEWDAVVKWAYISDLLPKQLGISDRLKGGEK